MKTPGALFLLFFFPSVACPALPPLTVILKNADHADCLFFAGFLTVVGLDPDTCDVKVSYGFENLPESVDVLPDGRLWIPMVWNGSGNRVVNHVMIVDDGARFHTLNPVPRVGRSRLIGDRIFLVSNGYEPADGTGRCFVINPLTLAVEKTIVTPDMVSSNSGIAATPSRYVIFGTPSGRNRGGMIFILDRKTLLTERIIRDGDIKGLRLGNPLKGDVKEPYVFAVDSELHTISRIDVSRGDALSIVDLDDEYGMTPFQETDWKKAGFNKYIYPIGSDLKDLVIYERGTGGTEPNRLHFFDPETFERVRSVEFSYALSDYYVVIARGKIWAPGNNGRELGVFDLSTGAPIRRVAYPRR